MSEPKTKAEWREYLRAEQEAHPDEVVMVNFARGLRDMRLRLWPPAIVYSKPPRSALGS